MERIGIIANPFSKLNKRKPHLPNLLKSALGKNGELQTTKSIEEIDRVILGFRDMGIKTIGINGGDGTIMHTLTRIISLYRKVEGGNHPKFPKILVLRGGTINTLADNLGIAGSPETILKRWLKRQKETEDALDSFLLSTLQVEDQFGFLFANGTSAYFLEEFYKNKTGPVGVFVLLTKLAGSFFASFLGGGQAFFRVVRDCSTTLITETGAGKAHISSSVLASTVPCMPFKIRLFEKMSLESSHDTSELQCVSVCVPAKQVLYHLPSLLIRPQADTHAKLSLCAKTLKINSGQNGPYTLDGELFYPKSNEITLKVGPKLEFIRP